MKQLYIAIVAALICSTASAQVDSTKTITDTTINNRIDTIRIGGMIIIRNNKNRNNNDGDVSIDAERKERKRNPNISTNWWIVDLGFSNYTDNTNYANTGNYLVNKPGSVALGTGDFKLRTGKSVNVNLWFFMQRLNVIKHHINLKYGLGLELNNYRYKDNVAISYKEGGAVPYSGGLQTSSSFIFRDSISFTKNKLAADYITVPLMINFSSNTQNKNKGISLSAGVSAGYLYSQRNKQRSAERGKDKNRGDYDLERFKLSYIAELGLGPVRLYGSYSPKSFYTTGLDMKPYTLGIRFSNW